MLEHLFSDIGGRFQFPSYEHTKLETMLHYDYIKAALTRLEQNLAEVQAFLVDPPTSWKPKTSTGGSTPQSEAWSTLSDDFDYLISRTKTLLRMCEDSKATLMSNASIQEAKRSVREAQLVTQLTKATNRITFIFLPISFVTSVFGMNFRQFGQGPLSIWLWAVITIPLLVVSVIIVEQGQWMEDKIKRIRKKDH
jgi:Mg2+ and Co2+ transporter CorA